MWCVQRLAPAINCQAPDKAHDLHNALAYLENSPRTSSDEKEACEVIKRAMDHLGQVGTRIQDSP